MKRLVLSALTTIVAVGLVGAASASATVTPSCIPTSNTPFTITVPGITAAELPYLGVLWAEPPSFSLNSRGALSNETITSSGLTATATFPAGLPSVTYDVAVTVSQPMQAIDAGSISVGCGVTPHPTATMVTCGSTPLLPGARLCTAVVTDDSSQPNTPSGTITFTSSAPASFRGSPCPVSGSGPSVACFAQLTAFALGPQTITASYSGDSSHQPSSGNTSVTVIKPPNSQGCRVTFKGQVTLPGGDLAHIAGNARGTGRTGRERYRDRGPANPLLLVSHTISAVACPSTGGAASIFGTGSLGKGQKVSYRIDVATGANATYRIVMSNGYDSGVAKLNFGSIHITRAG